MSHTGLAFYRRSQTLENLGIERPKSIGALHTLMLNAVDEVQFKLQRLERNYYCGMKCEEYLCHIYPNFKEVMEKFQVTFLHAAWQFDDVLRRYAKFGDQYGVDQLKLSKFREFAEKLPDFFPCKFDGVIQDIQQIMGFLKKYCLSFFKGKPDPLVETAANYEKTKEEFIAAVQREINNIRKMGLEYKDKGLTAKCFSTYINQVGRKCGCSYLPLLLGFPQACYNIRRACQKIVKWINIDKHYPEFVKSDIDELERKRVAQIQEVRHARENNVLTGHKHKALQKEAADMEVKVERLKPRVEQIDRVIADLQKKTSNIKIDMNLREEEMEDLRYVRDTGSSSGGESEQAERLDLLGQDIGRMRLTTFMINRQIEANGVKAKLIHGKEIELVDLKKEAIRYGKMTLVSKTEVVLAVRQMEKIERCLGQLKEIYMKRTCPNITRKIFHDMPIDKRNSAKISGQRGRGEGVRSAKSARPKKDVLDRVCLLVAKHIGSDWPKVYRELAFFPRRGEANIDLDIDEIIKTHYRSDNEIAAREALARWRRMHSRPSVPDLKRALSSASRRDIIQQIESSFRPKTETELRGIRRHAHIRQAISRFMMLKRMGMVLPPAQLAQAQQLAQQQSAMASHVAQSV